MPAYKEGLVYVGVDLNSENFAKKLEYTVSSLRHGGINIKFITDEQKDTLQGATTNEFLCVFEFSDDFSELKNVLVKESEDLEFKLFLNPPVEIPPDIRESIEKDSFKAKPQEMRERLVKDIINLVKEITHPTTASFWKNEKSATYEKFYKIANQNGKDSEDILNELKKEANKLTDSKLPPHTATLINAITNIEVADLTKLRKLVSSSMQDDKPVPKKAPRIGFYKLSDKPLPEPPEPKKAPRPGFYGENEDDNL
ncbi:hypothetical protein ACNVED_04340 [Legionella sp. D16C41]|uniref:hypothetical protein n=1 Tax=Legionella sp. D16C41 TaxID=3402688 RepID=UPI003AF9F5F2